MKFYLRNPNWSDVIAGDDFYNWFCKIGKRGVDWNLLPDQNKMGGPLCATFMNREIASLFVLKYSDWIIPEPPDIAPELNSYSYSEEGFDPDEPKD